ncbi:MAG: putative methionyl-tRNA formyl transferase, partial [Paucimonas sp.]|nr:putative methionyl-tRNA formyl transferase [Paucimonas sp.]
EKNISIENIHTEIVGSAQSDKQTFKVGAQLLVPVKLPVDELRQQLDALAQEMVVDIALGEKPAPEV